MMKVISVLGSTGSIGTQTLDVVRNQADIRIAALAAHSNIDLLEKQIREFRPELAVVWDENRAAELRRRVSDTGVRVMHGMGGLIAACVLDEADMVLTAVVGMIGIRPTIAAIEAGKDIALANKETLVCAGHIIMPLAKKKGVNIYPVDSEHSAIAQCLRSGEHDEIEKILLTASGGPFRGYTSEMLEHVTVEDALRHPSWSMGRKITIDSATMVNKGLEVMEASWLFDVPAQRIQVVIQPGSIIHSMVQFRDGAVIAQLGTPDMKLPIQYALCYPDRRYMDSTRLDFEAMSSIRIEKPDMKTFYALEMAYEAAAQGGSMPTVFNAANEYAVARFLNREIAFTRISEMIRYAMDHHDVKADPTVEDILKAEKETRELLSSL